MRKRSEKQNDEKSRKLPVTWARDEVFCPDVAYRGRGASRLLPGGFIGFWRMETLPADGVGSDYRSFNFTADAK